MKKLAIGALCSVASLAFAATEGTTETTSMGDSPIKVFANVDLNVTNIKTSGAGATGFDPDTGFGLAVGTDAVYNFTNDIGAGIGLDFNMLKGSKSGTEIKANYLDVPISFAYNIVPTSGLGITILAGPYVGIPIAKWKLTGAPDQKANIALGANLEAHTTWELSQGFGLGAHVGFKYAFNDLLKEDALISSGAAIDVNYWSAVVGVSAKFL
jgi:hypothetical protein